MTERRPALLLAPGAGADATSPALVAVEDALGPAVVTRRMDFPYRKAGRKAPDRAPVLLDAVRLEARALRDDARVDPQRLFLGGRSMGGRMCSMAVAEGLEAVGLVLISYPLHPPGRPDKLRIDHFDAVDVPCLFVSGDRDAFATPDELKKETAAIRSEVTLHFVTGADHSMKRGQDEMVQVVTQWISSRL